MKKIGDDWRKRANSALSAQKRRQVKKNDGWAWEYWKVRIFSFNCQQSNVIRWFTLKLLRRRRPRGLCSIVPKKGVRKCVCAQINDFSYYPNGVGDPSSRSFGKKPEVYLSTEIWWACPDNICGTTSKIQTCLLLFSLFLQLRKMYTQIGT